MTTRNIKYSITSLSAAAVVMLGALVFTTPAQASAYHGGYKHGYDYGHSYRHGRRYNRHARHHRRHVRRHHRHSRHYGRHSNRGAYLAGGLILGSLITHAVHDNRRYRESHRDGYVVRERRVVTDAPRTVSRRLFKDRDGNCFERTSNRDGDEVLSELDPGACAW